MNSRTGLYYLLGSLLLGIGAVVFGPVGWILLWPAVSLLLVSAGYFFLGPRVYFKRHGTHPRLVRVLHLFVLLGHEMSRRCYARNCAAWDELVPGLLIGRQLNDAEAAELVKAGVTSVLDLTSEFQEPQVLRELNYLNIPLLDLTAPTPNDLSAAIQFISDHIGSGKVYVHCKIGYSRTAAFVGSYLVRKGHAKDADEAIRMLHAARPSIIIRPEARAIIEEN